MHSRFKLLERWGLIGKTGVASAHGSISACDNVNLRLKVLRLPTELDFDNLFGELLTLLSVVPAPPSKALGESTDLDDLR